MYRCLDCGGIWTEWELDLVHTREILGVGCGTEDYYTAYCPRCGGEEIVSRDSILYEEKEEEDEN